MKHIFIFVIATILYASSVAQTIGSKVSIVAVDGKTYSGIIKEIQGNKYKVKYEGFDFEAWLTGNQFYVIGQAAPTKKNEGNPKNSAQLYSVGDKIDISWFTVWYGGKVLEVRMRKGLYEYKVGYAGWASSYDEWVTDNRIRPEGSTREYDKSKPEPKDINLKNPEMIGGIPKLVGTGWAVQSIYTKGTTPKGTGVMPNFIFCNDGHWEFQTSLLSGGTYKVQGNRLITVHDGSDKKTAIYIITWNAAENYLELDDGKLVFRMQYNGKTTC